MIENLAEVLKAEILKRVPNKELLRCSAVCKSWYALIKSPSFIFGTHQASSSSHLLILCQRLSPDHKKMSFHDDDTEELRECHLAPRFYSMSDPTLRASCNGLLLFYDAIAGYLLWNPSICRSLTLPKPNLSRFHCEDELSCLAFDSTTNDFKVLRLLSGFESRPNAKAEVYSLNAASWKNISHITPQYHIPSSFLFQRQSLPFVNGALHMIACDSSCLDKGTNLVLVFDVKDEIFREILLPNCLMNCDSECMMHVIAYGQSIAVVHIDIPGWRNDIWVMKEYGVYNSWTNLGNLHNEDRASAAMFFRKNGQFMMDSFGKFFSFDFATQSFTHLFPDLEEIKGIQGTVGTVERWPASVFTYMETLALLDRGNFKDESGESQNLGDSTN